MHFEIYGGFEICRKDNRLGLFDDAFWQRARGDDEDLPDACGVYVFAMKYGENIVPWYVGKTERRTFERECFEPTKINYYNDVLAERHGTPLLYLIPRCTAGGGRFSKPTAGTWRDIDFLETMLIGIAIERNPDLLNVRSTQMFREMVVPGIINTPARKPTSAESQLRQALGL